MDMLIKLYHAAGGSGSAMSSPGVEVRKPIAPEHDLVADWVAQHFSPGWSSEARAALANRPSSLFVATRGDPASLIGFCCYDAAARGFVGPIGVLPEARRTGVGALLLHACLADMRSLGYAYAVAGHVGEPAFFHQAAGATVIEGSTPSIYRGMLRA
jgi:ribosomal protein S18 acetylase RimI-like enzyme